MRLKVPLVRMDCSGGRCRCSVCGVTAKAPAKGFVLHGCPGPRPPRGLGDIVAGALASVGITKARISRLLGRDCGCSARQEALNKAGRAIGIGRKA